MRAVILDNEAVQALQDPRHPKHRMVSAQIQRVRAESGPTDTLIVVPTTVRVEAGWNRSEPPAARLNRLRVLDHVLDTATANTAAVLRGSMRGISVADAHLGATVQSVEASEILVLTSDPDDVSRVSSPVSVKVVRV